MLQFRQLGVGIFRQPFAIRLGALFRTAHQGTRVTGVLAGETTAAFNHAVRRFNPAIGLLCRGNCIPGATDFCLQRRLFGDEFTQGGFIVLLLFHQHRVLQSAEAPPQCLVAVFHAEQGMLGVTCRFGAAFAVLLQHATHFGQSNHAVDERQVAQGSQLRDGQLTLGRARLAGNEYHFPFLCTAFTEREIVFDLGRLAAFIGTQQGDIQVVARKVEVIRIAAKECCRFFRCPDQARILEAMVFVDLVLAAVIQVDDIATHGFLILADTG